MDEPDKADIIFVYDYCRLMWALSEEHAEHHWWASENLKKKLTGTGGPALVSAYNVMTQVGVNSIVLKLYPAIPFFTCACAFWHLIFPSLSLVTIYSLDCRTLQIQCKAKISKQQSTSLAVTLVDCGLDCGHPVFAACLNLFLCYRMQDGRCGC